MPRPPVPPHVEEFLRRPNPAVIATIGPAGQPVTVATWYLWNGNQAVVNMDHARHRLDHIRRDPRVSITVIDPVTNHHVTLEGAVATLLDDIDLETIDRISQHYIAQPYPIRDRPRITAHVTVDRWHGWGDYQSTPPPEGLPGIE